MVRAAESIDLASGRGPPDCDAVAWRPIAGGNFGPSPYGSRYPPFLGDFSPTEPVNMEAKPLRSGAVTSLVLSLFLVAVELMRVLAATAPRAAANSTGATRADGYVGSVYVSAPATHDG